MKQKPLGFVPPFLALAVSACAPDAGTGNPVAPPAGAVRASLAVRGEAVSALRAAVEDARGRVLPAIEDADATRRIGATLESLGAALADDDAAALAVSLEQAHASLRAERESLADPGAAAELDALLVLFTTLNEAVPASLRPAPAAD